MELTVTIEAVGQGGICIARHEGRVVFVPDVLPGETVRVVVPEPAENAKFWRAELREVLEPSHSRIATRWSEAGPGGVGGAELAHVELEASRRWKSSVIAEQLSRLAGLELAVEVEAAEGDVERDGLGWRTRVQFAVARDGRLGGLAPRSHRIVPLTRMPLATSRIEGLGILGHRFPGADRVEVIAPASGAQALVVVSYGQPPKDADGQAPKDAGFQARRKQSLTAFAELNPDVSLVAVDEPNRRSGTRRPRGRRQGSSRTQRPRRELISGQDFVEEAVAFTLAGDRVERQFRVTGGGFWQVHRAAPGILTQALLDAVAVQPGEKVADLYSGAGLFTAALAIAAGADGQVTGIEGDQQAVSDSERNLADLPTVRLHRGPVEKELAGIPVGQAVPALDVVTLDPPRSGAGKAVVEQIVAHRPRIVGYVSCDPATLARDIAYFAERGYRLSSLRAFDLFPLTHHVESLAVLTPGPN
ncbi:class I SAM-dependent RNA methyltransferase [Saxibacter everestensis]|uniref:Class I SAM-dependent RNA methyltransferase n=1 Tax=Saxibacter everestensis TaxID=2909229 RepID=A0ABY8QWP3_9MICO|nr:class I SAM-dependent RNA methyltransferase [Brevibacteriaceae bacterium ZFBP1038]